MPICPQCKSYELEVIYGEIYECPNCGFMQRISKFNEVKPKSSWEELIKENRWYTSICQDDSLWFKTAFYEYPSIISHEYYRLYSLLKSGQTYGALFQVKDLFEVILKIPVLIIMSSIFEKSNKSIEDMELISLSLGKALSLGDWRKILGRICKNKLVENEMLYPILKDIKKIYFDEKLDIVKWRNDTIGHGALKFDDNPEFRKELVERLIVIKKHFEKCEKYYTKLQFYLYEDGNRILLKGENNAKKLPWKSDKLYIHIHDKKINLYPYILYLGGEIFFYDAFIDNKLKLSMLNYPTGEKLDLIRNEIADHLHKLYLNSTKILEKNKSIEALSSKTDSVEDDSYLAESEDYLNQLENISDYKNPAYLEDWLRSMLDNHEKGIFLLQMERGMGKTTFCRALDKNSHKKLSLEDFTVKSFYFNDNYLSNPSYFLSLLSDNLRSNKEGKIVIKEEHIKTLYTSSKNKKEDFNLLIAHYKEKYKKHFGKDKLLLILDGIDEIVDKEKNSIFDYIPHEQGLDSGIYILLTCRTNKEISSSTLKRITELNIREHKRIEVFKENDANVNLISSYIQDELNITDKKTIDILLHKSEKRFLYISLLSFIIKNSHFKDYNFLPEGLEIFDYFLDKLNFYYSDKYFKELKNIISIIAFSKEPMSLKELSYLYGEDKISFKFLGYLYDIKGILRIDRSYRGNLISLYHEELKKLIKNKYETSFINVLNDRITTLCNEADSKDWHLNDGKTYLLSYLLDYFEEYKKAFDWSSIFTDEFLLYFFIIAKAIKNDTNFHKLYNQKRYFKLQEELIIMQDYAKDNLKEYSSLFYQLECLASLGDSLFSNIEKDYNLSIKRYEESIEKSIKLLQLIGIYLDSTLHTKEKYDLDEAPGTIINKMAESYADIGRVYYRIGKMSEAYHYYSKALKVYENLIDKENMNLTLLYLEISRVYSATNKFKEAIELANKIYEDINNMITNEVDADYKNSLKSTLIKVMECIGRTYLRMNDSEKAQLIFLEAIKMSESIENYSDILHLKAYSTVLYNAAGEILFSQKQFKESIPYYKKTIEIFKYIESKGLFYEKMNCMEAYLKIGICYLDIGKYRDSINNIKKAFKLLENEVQIILPNSEAYYSVLYEGTMAMADSYYLLKNYNQAINSYIDLIKIIEKKSNGFIGLKDLEITLLRLYSSYVELNKNNEACMVYESIEKLKFFSKKPYLNCKTLHKIFDFSKFKSL